MLSPNTRQTESSPIKSAPIIKACASPSGDGCSAYFNFTPKADPSPSTRLNSGKSYGVEIISISRIPANIRVEIG